jgi:hypothetical protein
LDLSILFLPLEAVASGLLRVFDKTLAYWWVSVVPWARPSSTLDRSAFYPFQGRISWVLLSWKRESIPVRAACCLGCKLNCVLIWIKDWQGHLRPAVSIVRAACEAEGSKSKTKSGRGHFKSAVRVLVTKSQAELSFIEQRH